MINKKNTIAAGHLHSLILKNDGKVRATGDNDCGLCDTSSWVNIVEVAAGNVHMAANTRKSHSV